MRLPVLLGRVAPAIRRAKKSGTAPWLAWLAGHVASNPSGLFCELDAERISYGEAAARVRALAAVLARHGLEPGDRVALIGGNSPMYLLLVLAVAYAGGAAALINPELGGEPLAHALRAVGPKLSLLEHTQRAPFDTLSNEDRALAQRVLTYGDANQDLESAARGVAPLDAPRAIASGDFVLIFTSGTTGLPKPCRVRHDRARSAATIFGSVAFEFRAGDKLYCPLPLHHSSALLVGVGAALVAGVPVVLRRKFSAREFIPDLVRTGATASLYIGETCRALLRVPANELERRSKLRLLVGNGLDADTWRELRARFPRVRVREFYASTEAPSAILNLNGELGSLGHVPFETKRGFRLARLDDDQRDLFRNSAGHAELCAPNEPGELLLRVSPSAREPHGEFGGYTDEAASSARILHGVFEPGDAYFRSGDVLRRDRAGYFYFVDRLGDAYRWKGENISALQVERVLAAALGGAELAVAGVAVPGHPGRAGLAELVAVNLDVAHFTRATRELPAHARPLFVHLVPALDRTSSFKVKKRALDLASLVSSCAAESSLWIRQGDSYVVLNPKLWDDLCRGRIRL